MTLANTAGMNRIPSRPLTLQRDNGHRPRLLLAEDSDPIRVVTAAMLKGMGCDVDAVAHGEEAVRSASTYAFDVIVLDIEMPVMDGITAARSIRRLGGKASATPIMALSAFLADAMQSASWSDTFDIALPKPANKNELHAALQRALAQVPRLGEAEAGDGSPLLSDDLLERLGAGLPPGLLRDLLAVACRDIDVCAQQLSRAAAEGRADQFRIYAQKLKALGTTFATPRLTHAAETCLRATPTGGDVTTSASLLETAQATSAALRGL